MRGSLITRYTLYLPKTQNLYKYTGMDGKTLDFEHLFSAIEKGVEESNGSLSIVAVKIII